MSDTKAVLFREEEDRYEQTSIAQFGVRLPSGRKIMFHPVVYLVAAADEVYIDRVSLDGEVLYCDQEELYLVNEAFNKYGPIIYTYFQVFVHVFSYPWPRSALESLYSLILTDEEKKQIQQMLSELTFIYLIRDARTGYVKIGRSNDPEGRLQQLKKQDTLMPYANDFTILYVFEDHPHTEKLLHRVYRERRVRGEWFALTDSEIEAIKKSH